jgi:hypothetical protein
MREAIEKNPIATLLPHGTGTFLKRLPERLDKHLRLAGEPWVAPGLGKSRSKKIKS